MQMIAYVRGIAITADAYVSLCFDDTLIIPGLITKITHRLSATAASGGGVKGESCSSLLSLQRPLHSDTN